MARYRIRNWAKFQHYKDRNPPWIKLHVEILSSADWVTLDDASKLLAVVCMIVGAKDQGCITADAKYFKRVAYLSKAPDFNPLVECGFLEPLAAASKPEQEQAEFRPEKEGETEKEAEKIIIAQPRASRFGDFWAVCPKKVGKGKAKSLFDRACRETGPDLLIAAMQRYAISRAGEDAQFTKHPATWLSQRCWEDEGTGPPQASAEIIALRSAFSDPEELELQRQMTERTYGKATN